MPPADLLARLRRRQFTNVRFEDADRLLRALGFELRRVRGSHHIYLHRASGQQLNLQPNGRQAKPYQLRQLLDLVEGYDLEIEE